MGSSDLVAGLRAAMQLDPESLEWSTGKGATLVIQGAQAHIQPGPTRAACQVVLRRKRPASWWERLRHLGQHTMAEHRAASHRCRFAPVAVLVDNRQVNDPNPGSLVEAGLVEGVVSVNYPKRFGLIERYLVVSRPIPSTLAAPSPISKPAEYYQVGLNPGVYPTPVGPPRQTLLYQARKFTPVASAQERALAPHPALAYHLPKLAEPRPLACWATLCVPARLEGAGQVQVVHNGVCLERRSEDLGCPGAVAVVSSLGLTLDPTGLGLVPDAHYASTLSILRQQIKEMLKEVVPHLRRLDPPMRNYVKTRLTTRSSGTSSD